MIQCSQNVKGPGSQQGEIRISDSAGHWTYIFRPQSLKDLSEYGSYSAGPCWTSGQGIERDSSRWEGRLGIGRETPITTSSFCPLVCKQEEAEARLPGSGCSLPKQQHSSFLSLPFCSPHALILPRWDWRAGRKQSLCVPPIPLEGLQSPLVSSSPDAGDHFWRRITSLLDVSHAWSKPSCLAHQPTMCLLVFDVLLPS